MIHLTHEKFCGCWRLVECDYSTSDGDKLEPFGKDPIGVFMYDEQGNYSAQIMRRDRPKFEDGGEFADTAKAAYQGYVAYFGKSTVDLEERTLTNHVTGSLNPDWVGGDQIRKFEFADGLLVLRPPPMKFGEKEIYGKLTWKRDEGE